MKLVCGKIRSVNLDERIFCIATRKKLDFYYLTRSQMKKFQPYIQEGLLVYFKAYDEAMKHGNCFAYEVINFIKMDRVINHRHNIYYDIVTIKDGVKKLLNKDTYRMFLDLEFSMPPFNSGQNSGFYSEIIQYGIYIEDASGKCVETASGLIKPTCKLGLSDRTISFLHVSKEKLLKAPNYQAFYNTLKDFMMFYQPVIYVWGKNDYLMISRFYELYKLKPITDRKNFVNLMQIIKNYYSRKDDIGLYPAYKLFGADPPLEEQDHDALHDALATVEVYHLFEKEINQK